MVPKHRRRPLSRSARPSRHPNRPPPPSWRPSLSRNHETVEAPATATDTADGRHALRRRGGTGTGWPPTKANAYGRVVRVGKLQPPAGKQGWQRIAESIQGCGAARHLVVPNPSLRTGQMFYRLQFGTTSQAHSEILCQRMRIVAQSCVTVGLPAARGARG